MDVGLNLKIDKRVIHLKIQIVDKVHKIVKNKRVKFLDTISKNATDRGSMNVKKSYKPNRIHAK